MVERFLCKNKIQFYENPFYKSTATDGEIGLKQFKWFEKKIAFIFTQKKV
jgi:hypothetical protein